MDPLGREHVRPDRLDQRHQAGGRGADPIGKGADIDLHPFPGVDRALPGEWQMLAVLRGQHQGQQVRTGTATGDRVRGRRRLADRLAAAAGDLLPHVLDHLPAARHAFEGLGHVLAQLADGAAALGAGAGRGVDDPLARQVLRQGPAGRLAGAARPCRVVDRRCRDLGRGLRFGGGLLELGQLQLELGDDVASALGGLAVLLAPGLGEQQLQALDLQPGAGHSLRPRPPAVRRAPRGSSRARRRGQSGSESKSSHRRTKQNRRACQHRKNS